VRGAGDEVGLVGFGESGDMTWTVAVGVVEGSGPTLPPE